MNGLILIIALILTILLILGYCNLIKKYGKKDLSIGHLIYDFIDI